MLMKREYFNFLTVKNAEIHFYCKILHFLPNIILKSESFAGFLGASDLKQCARTRNTRIKITPRVFTLRHASTMCCLRI